MMRNAMIGHAEARLRYGPLSCCMFGIVCYASWLILQVFRFALFMGGGGGAGPGLGEGEVGGMRVIYNVK